MTKLLQWVTAAVLFIGSWMGILRTSFGQTWSFFIIPAPFLALVIFGIYAVTVVLYRVYTFNDCPEAAEEIRKQIKEARTDLSKKGLKFDRTE